MQRFVENLLKNLRLIKTPYLLFVTTQLYFSTDIHQNCYDIIKRVKPSLSCRLKFPPFQSLTNRSLTVMPSAQQKKRAEKKKQQERERMAKKNNKKVTDEPEDKDVEKVFFKKTSLKM